MYSFNRIIWRFSFDRNSNAIRSRKDLEPVKINKDSTSKKIVIDDKFEKPKVNNNNIKQQVATKSTYFI